VRKLFARWCLWSSRRKIVTNDGFSNDVHRGSATFSLILKIKNLEKIQQKPRSRFLLRFRRVDSLVLKINRFIRGPDAKVTRVNDWPWSCAVYSNTTFERFRATPTERLKCCLFCRRIKYIILVFSRWKCVRNLEIMASCLTQYFAYVYL